MFGDTLKQLRKKRGITQTQLAAAIGVEQSSIGKYEGKSHVMPSNDVMMRIAEYFGVSVDYLLRQEAIQAIKDDVPFPEMIKPSDYDFFHLLTDLTPEEKQRVRDFVAGLKSSDKA